MIDGARKIKPRDVGPDRITFDTPPRFTSNEVEIVIANGDEASRHRARILPHDPEATKIPIELIREPVCETIDG